MTARMIPQQAETRAQWDNRAAEADDEGGGFQADNNESASLRPTKKRGRSTAGKKLPLKRRVKRHRFSSPFSSDEETETGAESDTSSYAPAKTIPHLKPSIRLRLSLFDRP
ncbi:MAG: hypothetical protein Q9179_005168, partial [Wetmoreana sp. 5 TL-2023]